MKKFKALNYIELTIAMVIIGIITVIGLQIMRPEKKSYDPLFMGVWDNLMKANEEIIYANEQDGGSGLPADSTAYCEKLGEEFSIKNKQECGGNLDNGHIALILINGIELSCFKDYSNSNYIFVKAAFDRPRNNDEDAVRSNFIISKSDGMVIPLEGCKNTFYCTDSVAFQGCKVSDTTDHYKFRVISKETGEIVRKTQEGVSFQDAVCYMGVNSTYNITCRNGVSRDSNICPYPASCRIDMIMPKLKGFI